MGYYVEDIDFNLTIESKEQALGCLHELMARGKQYSWVSSSAVLDCISRGDIEEAFREWGYDLSPDLQLEGREREKWGDDEAFWKAIAPSVKKDSYIAFRGECGALWRYIFTQHRLVEQAGTIHWE